MMTAKKRLDDFWGTWIDAEYALPATDENMIVTVQDPDGSTHVEMGFYDGILWAGYDGDPVTEKDGKVIAWASVAPYERNTKQENDHE